MVLKEAADRSLDEEERPIRDFENVEAYIMKAYYFYFLKCMRKVPLLGRTFNKYLYHYLAFCYDAAVNHIEAHEKTHHILKGVKLETNFSIHVIRYLKVKKSATK